MTDNEIRTVVDLETNSLDRRFLSSTDPMSQQEYEARIAALEAWALQQYELPESLRNASKLPNWRGTEL